MSGCKCDKGKQDRIKVAMGMVEQAQRDVAESMAEVQAHVKDLVDYGMSVVEQSMYSNRHTLAKELQEKQNEYDRKIKEINDRLNCTLNSIEDNKPGPFNSNDTIKQEEGGLTNRERIISLLDKVKKDPNIGIDKKPVTQPADKWQGYDETMVKMMAGDQWTPEQIEELRTQRKKDLAQIAVCADIMAKIIAGDIETEPMLDLHRLRTGGWRIMAHTIEAAGLSIEDVYSHIYSLAERHKRNLESLQTLTTDKF